MKIKLIILILSFFYFGSMSYAQNPTFQWASAIGGASQDNGLSIAVDATGNVYTTGTFSGTADFDPGSGTYNLTANGMDFFISKVDPSGNFIWAKSIGGSGFDVSSSIALDALGNVYTTGTFQGTVDFDPGSSTFNLVNNNNGLFILKLNTSGSFVWADGIITVNASGENYLTLDATGNIYATGGFSGNLDFDPGPGTFNLSSGSNIGVYILKLNNNGGFSWAKSFTATTSTSAGYGTSLDFDLSGNIYIPGYYQGTMDFDPSAAIYTITAVAGSDIFVSKLDPSGNFIWAKSMGGMGYDYGQDIKVDQTGNVYTSGYFAGTADFDPGSGTYTMMVSTGAFISKLDASGNFLWAKGLGGMNGSSYCYSIELDALGDVYTTGYFTGSGDFDPGIAVFTMTASGAGDPFISKLDGLGNFVWAKSFGGNQKDVSNCMVIDSNNSIYTTGYFQGTSFFDPGIGTYSLTSMGMNDIFIQKLAQCTAPLNPVDITPVNKKVVCENKAIILSVSGAGTITWFSSLSSTVNLWTGNSFTTPLLGAGIYTYYAEANTCTNSISRTAITVTVNSCVGFELNGDVSNGSFVNVFPNPFSQQLSMEAADSVSAMIYDLNGKLVYENSFEAGISHINTEALSAGLYIVNLSTPSGTWRGKLAKID